LNWWVARAAGVSAWQFHRTGAGKRDRARDPRHRSAYNPMSANLRELSKRMEAELFGYGARRRHSGRLRLLAQSGQQ